MTDYTRELELKLFFDGEETIPGEKGSIPNANGHLVLKFMVDKQLDKPDMCTFSLSMLRSNEFVVLDKVKLGTAIRLRAGFNDPDDLFEGEIVHINPRFSAGRNELELVCYSKLWRLTVGNRPRYFGDGHEANVSAASVLQTVVDEAGAQNSGGKSDGLSVSVGSHSGKIEYAAQVGLNDFAFLSQVTGGIGFSARRGSSAAAIELKAVELSGSPVVKIFRDRVDAGDDCVPAIRADFTNSCVRQVSEVWFRGYDHYAREGFVGKATEPSTVLGGASGVSQTGKALYGSSGDGRIIQVVDAPVASEEEAKEMAQAFLDHLSMNWMEARVQIPAYAGVEPGDLVEMKDFGTRFSGLYSVQSVQHLWSGGASTPMQTNLVIARNGSPEAS